MGRIWVVPAAAAISLALVTACGSSPKISDCPFAGTTKCGSACVDLQVDQLNCGACGRACASGIACAGGACLATRRVLTNCGATGPGGPAPADCAAVYTPPLSNEVAVAAGIQEWTAPRAGTYRIAAAGAQGESATPTFRGGLGALVRGDFALSAGKVLLILVGQAGTATGKATNSGSGGGGGGTFVVDKATGNALLVAGGGGGTRQQALQNGCDGRITDLGGAGSGGFGTESGFACGPRAAGTAGTGGGSAGGGSWGSGGGGFTTDGASDCTGTGGVSFTGGGSGGSGSDGAGGFGGGGSGDGCAGGGGGGGYSGGEGGFIGGGGGSFNGGTNQVSFVTNGGHGWVIVDGP